MKSPNGIICATCKRAAIRFWPRPEGMVCLSCVAKQEMEIIGVEVKE